MTTATTRQLRTTRQFVLMVQRMIRAAARRVGEGDPEDLVDLVDLRAVLDIAIHDAVQAQRAAGITWRAIGEATGTSHVAAIQKWGRS